MAPARASRSTPHYMELFRLCQRARTLPPTEVITAMAATTIRPAISAYSSTSPPCSSRISFLPIFEIARTMLINPFPKTTNLHPIDRTAAPLKRDFGMVRRVTRWRIVSDRAAHKSREADYVLSAGTYQTARGRGGSAPEVLDCGSRSSNDRRDLVGSS